MPGLRGSFWRLILHGSLAAIDGQLGQHQTVAPDGMPILDDPRFLLYERVGKNLIARMPNKTVRR